MNVKALVLMSTALLIGVFGLVLTTWVEPFNTAHVSLFSMTVTVDGETFLSPYRNLGGILMFFGTILFTVGFISSYFRAHVEPEKMQIRELEMNVMSQNEITVGSENV